jgi:hypothetical protein
MAVLARLHPFAQPLEILLKLLPVLLDGDPIHSDRCVLPQSVVRACERWLVDEPCQRQKPLMRIPLRSFSYPLQFR